MVLVLPSHDPRVAEATEPATEATEEPDEPETGAGLVSVVLAVTDAQVEFLDECLDSLRTQSYERLQVIVVPFGNCTEAVAIARRHAAEDDRVELDDEVRLGLGSARNAGARAAQGQYVAFMGGGDRLPGRAYEFLVQSLTNSPRRSPTRSPRTACSPKTSGREAT
jgi:hypothetical protein